MQLASQNPLLRTGCCWLGNFFARLAGPLPSKCTLTFAHSFAELLRNFCEKNPIRRPQPSAGGASKEKQTTGALVFGSGKASLLEAWLLHLGFVSWDFTKGYQCQPEIKIIKTIHGTMSRSYPCKELHCTMHLYSVLMVIHNIQLLRNFRGVWRRAPGGLRDKNPYMDYL